MYEKLKVRDVDESDIHQTGCNIKAQETGVTSLCQRNGRPVTWLGSGTHVRYNTPCYSCNEYIYIPVLMASG